MLAVVELGVLRLGGVDNYVHTAMLVQTSEMITIDMLLIRWIALHYDFRSLGRTLSPFPANVMISLTVASHRAALSGSPPE